MLNKLGYMSFEKEKINYMLSSLKYYLLFLLLDFLLLSNKIKTNIINKKENIRVIIL